MYAHHALNIQVSVPKLPRIAHSMLLINQEDKTQAITSSNTRVTRTILYQRSAPDRSTQEGINLPLKGFQKAAEASMPFMGWF